MTERTPILGVVLAGGDSRRMGSDKALLRWQGVPLVRRSVETLRTVLPRVVVVGGAPAVVEAAGTSLVADRQPGLGPLGGLATAFEISAGESVFALACDLPGVTTEVVADLVGRADEGVSRAAAWVARADGRTQPLCGLYLPSCEEPLIAFLQRGERRAGDFLSEIDARVVEYDPGHPLHRPGLLRNVNRPEDLAAGEIDS